MPKSKKTNLLSHLSDIAKYLEEAGYVDKSKIVRDTMNTIDGSFADDEDYLIDPFTTISDEERNVGGPSPTYYNGSLGGGGNFSTDIGAVASIVGALVKVANSLDQKGAYKEATKMDKLIHDIIEGKIIEDRPKKKRKKKKKKKKQNEDAIARSNGRVGTGVTDNQNAGMFQGFSDAYFYSGYGNLEGAYGPTDR